MKAEIHTRSEYGTDAAYTHTFVEVAVADFKSPRQLTNDQRPRGVVQFADVFRRTGYAPTMEMITVDDENYVIDGNNRLGALQALLR